ncbi:hypothetical protein RCL_jg27313.t1 [Rhizophagus clarus]|uniref:Uncharacterized protein n=1 Tax=Rhizophagus clarus TaxID=94130 RepID=A0A8H3LXF1_9GLOM|nr:hypothetical protein RCL_jg27313.t1 [Rhizophagus clarus]
MIAQVVCTKPLANMTNSRSSNNNKQNKIVNNNTNGNTSTQYYTRNRNQNNHNNFISKNNKNTPSNRNVNQITNSQQQYLHSLVDNLKQGISGINSPQRAKSPLPFISSPKNEQNKHVRKDPE